MSTQHQESLTSLMRTIETCPPNARYTHIPKLRRMIAQREAHGDTPPQGARHMLKSLEEEAIESLFDNMPI
ncbi:hypothetical protein [Roseovarius sp. E0-M6]|uniref:hypothetical protein n=1 Tax=Roseovarius sp. E0-M6 TaxID=3127118 RepID=UPI00300F9A52